MGERQRKPHAIMISVPFQGHINPFVSLALKLASKGFTITFVHLDFIHLKLSKAHNKAHLFSEARQLGLDIRYTTISDGLPLEFDRDFHFEEYWEIIVRDFAGRVDDFVGKMIQLDPNNGYFLVADSIYEWPAAIADKYNLVNVSFWTQPALVFSLVYHWDLLEEKGHFPCKENMEEEINYLPGVDSINTKDLMAYFKESDLASIVTRGTRLAFEGVKKAHFILHNTVHELESETISALKKYRPNYAIGPISFSKTVATTTAQTSLLSESDCTQWLASKPPGSVLYVSFGSLVQTSKQMLEEIACGLLLSEVNFIWVIRKGILSDGDANVLPAGFEDKIKDRGLIVPWCDQVRILSNQAIGGFLTHCGWNSTLESMWYGVPMMCYPIGFEQFTNRKLVVEDWKIGIDLCDGRLVNRKEVGDKIKSFVEGAKEGRFKEQVNKVKAILHNALQIDGSSESNFDQFVKDLEVKIYGEAQNDVKIQVQ